MKRIGRLPMLSGFTCRHCPHLLRIALVVGVLQLASSALAAPLDGLAGWRATLGASFGIVGQDHRSAVQSTQHELSVNNQLSPILRVGYPLSPDLLLEGSARLDFYSGNLASSQSGSSERLDAWGAGLGLVWFCPRPIHLDTGGTGHPFLHASILHQDLYEEPDYTVESFDPAWGIGAGVGFATDTWELRLGYRWLEHDADRIASGVTAHDGDLDLSSVFLEASWVLTGF